jgi:hypothetical protein
MTPERWRQIDELYLSSAASENILCSPLAASIAKVVTHRSCLAALSPEDGRHCE